jgi:coenzyme F420-0:L-glutamate ligase/coenzyme F420-1:gamma-L-glutamate ligase
MLAITALDGFPLIKRGDDLAKLILQSLLASKITLINKDILVLAQKIVSKAEGRIINLRSVKPSDYAVELATFTGKDPRIVELILRESKEVLRARPGTIIVEHRLGFVCANAGIDHSNVTIENKNTEEFVLLLPENPDLSAIHIQNKLESELGVRIGIMIIDSHGRAWRMGVVGVSIGIAGLPGLVDMRGKYDLFGGELRITQIAVADELAAAASLVMGQADEGFPAIHARGFPYHLRNGSLQELIRPNDQDLFR